MKLKRKFTNFKNLSKGNYYFFQLCSSFDLSCKLLKGYLIYRLEKENFELRKQRDSACDERDGLQMQVERRDSDLERLRIEVNSLGSQLQAAVTAKCQALSQMEEIRSLEMTLDFKFVYYILHSIHLIFPQIIKNN